jgi:general secretion pathway protein M
MSVRARLDKLEARERRLLSILGAIAAVLVLLAGPIGLFSVLSSKRKDNEDLRALITEIHDSRAQVGERKAKHDALLLRYAKPAPPLASFIDEAAKVNGISAAESQDRPDVPHGKRYAERVAVVKMHKVGMLALAKTLEKIEQSGYPVSITRLNIRPRSGEPDSYEVELGVSAFDRKGEAPPPTGGGAGAAASATAAPGRP